MGKLIGQHTERNKDITVIARIEIFKDFKSRSRSFGLPSVLYNLGPLIPQVPFSLDVRVQRWSPTMTIIRNEKTLISRIKLKKKNANGHDREERK